MSASLPYPMKFGIFLAPFHPVGQNPTLALERDLDLLVHLDRLGFDEAWIGEHHSAGYEIIASPEVFIAVAAERTNHIRLGTGVNSLPYHHPLMLTDRLVLLDHLTARSRHARCRTGRAPVRRVHDGHPGRGAARPHGRGARGDPVAARQRRTGHDEDRLVHARRRAAEPASVHPSPLRGCGGVADLPAGSRAAGRFGTGLLSIGATNQQGFDLLGYHWQIAEERAAQFGTSVDRRNWRLVGPVHIAETREQAYADVQFGLADWVDYFQRVAALPIAPDTSTAEEMADAINKSGFAVIGTPDDAIAQLQRLCDQSDGGFGTFLVMAHDWADTEPTRRSYELLARYVFPAFQGSAESTTNSRDWAAENRPTFIGEVGAAIMTAIGKHNAEREKDPAAAD